MKKPTRWIYAAALAASLATLAACGGGDSGIAGTPVTRVAPVPIGPVVPADANIAGGISGLNDSGLVLQLNGASDLALTNGASFYTFSTALAAGASYTVTVKTQPKSLNCTLASPTGTVSAGAGQMLVPVTCTGLPLFAYVSNYGSDDISVYKVGASGQLTANGGVVAAGTSPYSVTIDPGGRFAFVANFDSNNVSAYTIGVNGQLTANGDAVSSPTRISSIVVTYVRP